MFSLKNTTIKTHILWPGGNTTALVEENIPRSEYFNVARKILAENKDVEQVGFLEKPENPKAAIRLQMMGGEFCGNAARTTAYFFSKKSGLTTFKMEVSGFSELLTAKIKNDIVELQFPGSFFKAIDEVGQGPSKVKIVDLMGIRFIIQNFPKDLERARKLIEKHQEDLPAVGVLFGSFQDEKITIDPIVWVRETNTCYDETACGSGSIAVAIAQHLTNPNLTTFEVVQPSREKFKIEILSQNGKISVISFTGLVKNLGERSVNP